MNHNFQIKEEKPLSKQEDSRRRIRISWNLKKISITFLLLASIAAIGVVLFFGKSILAELASNEKEAFVESALPELDQKPQKQIANLKEGTTFLLIGSDKRWGATEKWGRSDTILLAKISAESRAVSILSLPRDLLVPIPGYGEDKINAAYSYGGPGLLIATVREYLGVPINHFFQVSFDGFAEIIRGFPGKRVYIPVDARYYHSNEGLSASAQYSEIDLRPGYQALGAEDALSFVRFRHLDSDIYRASRQQLFLREVARQVYAQSNGGLSEIQSFARSVAKAGASDFSSLGEALRLANTLRKIPPSRVLRLTLSGESSTGSSGAYLLSPSPEDLRETLRLWNNPSLLLDKQKSIESPEKNSREKLVYLENMNSLAKVFQNRSLSLGTARLLASSREEIVKEKSRVTNKESPVSLVEQDRSLVKDLTRSKKLKTCLPTKLPPGYSWPSEASHKYKLAKNPALSLYATKSSGASILWMWTTWSNPPILENPDDALRIKGKQYFLFWESGNLRTIAWNKGATQTWISNTLRNELSPDEMIALARSCR